MLKAPTGLVFLVWVTGLKKLIQAFLPLQPEGKGEF